MSKYQDKIVSDVLKERNRQDKKWGKEHHKHPMGRWYTILGEEVGEVGTAIQMVYESAGPGERFVWRKNLREELIQVSAVALAWVEDMDRSGDEIQDEIQRLEELVQKVRERANARNN